MTEGKFQEGGTLRPINPKTIQDKVLVGYQGWFTCAGDGEPIGPGHHGWLHWFNGPIPTGGRPNTDLWPDVSEYDPSELYPAPGLKTSSGDPVYLFSSRHPKTVRRHFHWMALHGVDGAFLQRFAGQTEVKAGNMGIRDLRDEIGERVREAAEAEGRVFAIMYDVSGVSPDRIQNILEQDWIHLIRDQHVLDSPNYLFENGRPVVSLWGFGLDGREFTPELVRAITEFFRSSTPGGVYLVAGTPGHWRTSTSDADRNPGFVQMWTDCFDAISPWTVGRYGDEEGADRWGEERVKADADYLKKLEEEGGRKVDYMPVVLPGGSGFNLSEGKWGMNDIRRNGGRFLWRQVYNARRAGVRTIYGAMWDEYDEGTVFMPVVSHSSQLPVHPSFRFIALDVDGHDLPPDWYMRVLGFAAEGFHGERTLQDTFPEKELRDYWSTRPRWVAKDDKEEYKKHAADMDAITRAFGAWPVSMPSDAPPPYSLEDGPVPQRPALAAVSQSGVERAGKPPVRLDTRPFSTPLSSAPPPVDMSTRPSSLSSTRVHRPSAEFSKPPPVPPRLPPPLHPTSLAPAAYGVGLQHSTNIQRQGHGHSPGAQPTAYPPYPSGNAPRPVSSPHAGMASPPAPGHFPVPTEHGHGRSATRMSSRSRSRSGSPRVGHSPVHQHAPHGGVHEHGHSVLPQSTFPGVSAAGGLQHAYSESSAHGSYTPMHSYSYPVGRGAPAHAASMGPAYGGGQVYQPAQPQVGYDATGYGQGGYSGTGMGGPMVSFPYPPQQGSGYMPYPPSSPPSQYYASYAPGPGAGGGGWYASGPMGRGGG